MNSLHILKTNIQSKSVVRGLAPALNTHRNIKQWSIDFEDVDKVLRIEADNHLKQDEILQLIKQNGFHGEELKD